MLPSPCGLGSYYSSIFGRITRIHRVSFIIHPYILGAFFPPYSLLYYRKRVNIAPIQFMMKDGECVFTNVS
jgi:hypothetical protein